MAITSEKNVRSGALIKTYLKVAELWKLTLAEQTAFLGMPENSGLFTSWRNIPSSANLDKDKLVKLTLILAVYKDVQTLYPDNEKVNQWLRTAINDAPFSGLTPIESLKTGQVANLLLIRQYLATLVSTQ